MSKRVLIVGATGLIGQAALKMAQQHVDIEKIGLLVRSDVSAIDPRIQVFKVPSFSVSDLSKVDLNGFDTCWYCAGVLPIGLSTSGYRFMTVELTQNVARAFSIANPKGRLIYISGLGANPTSSVMPFKVKGEAETSLGQLPIEVCCIRPGVVQPTQGVRSKHALRSIFYQVVSPLLSLASAHAKEYFTTTTKLAQALIGLSFATKPLPKIIENKEIDDWIQ